MTNKISAPQFYFPENFKSLRFLEDQKYQDQMYPFWTSCNKMFSNCRRNQYKIFISVEPQVQFLQITKFVSWYIIDVNGIKRDLSQRHYQTKRTPSRSCFAKKYCANKLMHFFLIGFIFSAKLFPLHNDLHSKTSNLISTSI